MNCILLMMFIMVCFMSLLRFDQFLHPLLWVFAIYCFREKISHYSHGHGHAHDDYLEGDFADKHNWRNGGDDDDNIFKQKNTILLVIVFVHLGKGKTFF